MQMSRFVEALQADLEVIAGAGDETTARAGQRLSNALRSSAGLRLLDALGEAALELSGQLPSGRVEVRLAGGYDAELVYIPEEEATPSSSEEASSARITLRLPEALKSSVEAAAAREGVSVNTWIVRALSRGVAAPRSRVGSRLTGFARS